MRPPERQVRAVHDRETIRVYQAFGNEVADAALAAGTFVPPFRLTRMSWIKPSFLWMMYRSGWGLKPGQERVLAIDIHRAGFEWALRHAGLAHGPRADKTRPVRVQWDPERSIHLERLPYRSIQVGLSGAALRRYAKEWTVAITEVTDLASRVNMTRDPDLLPNERPYPLPEDITAALCP